MTNVRLCPAILYQGLYRVNKGSDAPALLVVHQAPTRGWTVCKYTNGERARLYSRVYDEYAAMSAGVGGMHHPQACNDDTQIVDLLVVRSDSFATFFPRRRTTVSSASTPSSAWLGHNHAHSHARATCAKVAPIILQKRTAHMSLQPTDMRQNTRKPKPPTKRLVIYFSRLALRSSPGNDDASSHSRACK